MGEVGFSGRLDRCDDCGDLLIGFDQDDEHDCET